MNFFITLGPDCANDCVGSYLLPFHLLLEHVVIMPGHITAVLKIKKRVTGIC